MGISNYKYRGMSMSYKITLIPGDGVGPEVVEATKKVLKATGIEFQWDVKLIGEDAYRQFGSYLPEDVLESIKRNNVALKGPVTTPIGKGFRSVNVALRKSLDLYTCLRPCKTYPGVPTRYDNVDIVVIRENTEDLYAGIEFARGTPGTGELIDLIMKVTRIEARQDSGFSIKMISEKGSERIARFAFEYARNNNRKKVSIAHKANILKYTDGLFLDTARRVADEYPDIACEDVVIDALCMRLVKDPQQYDVIVLPNLYGDIVSDLCAGLIGGLGVASGANIGDNIAVFEPTHGSAPRYTGQNKVNPIAMMLSATMMLRYLGEQNAATRLENAIAGVITEGKSVTYDLKLDHNQPAATTMEVADAVIGKLK
jgi:isocitrate dehydrogenase (NAD+)